MSFMRVILLLSAVSAVFSDDGASRCLKLYNFADGLVAYVKENEPRVYKSMEADFKDRFGVDVNNPVAFKSLSCRVVDAKTLRDVLELMQGINYEDLVKQYKSMQQIVVMNGGYTALLKNHQCSIDFMYLAINSTEKKEGAQRVSEVIDLSTLTHLLEVMQVRYGSRWLSNIYQIPNQDFLLEDPKKLAKDLIECETAEEFKGRVQSMFQYNDPEVLWKVFLDVHQFQPRIEKSMAPQKFTAEGLTVLGEVGLLTLKY